MHLPGERLQLDQAGNTWDHEAWINGNFTQLKLLGQETRYGHVEWLDVPLTIYHMCVPYSEECSIPKACYNAGVRAAIIPHPFKRADLFSKVPPSARGARRTRKTKGSGQLE